MSTLQTRDACRNDPNNLIPIAVESLRFPLDSSMRIVFTGYYTGYSVEVRSVDEIALLYHMGSFGKGSASRSKPRVAQSNGSPCIMRKRQFAKRTYWNKKFGSPKKTLEPDLFLRDVDELTAKIISDSERLSNKDVIDLVSSDEVNSEVQDDDSIGHFGSFHKCDKQDIAVIVPNSDSEGDNYFANLKPKCCMDKIKIQEKLMLTLQEAFFLLYALGCLQIFSSNDKLLTIEQCWQMFIDTDKYFIPKYVVYHYFRSKGYIVKPGIKFGGDYLLYKEGPGISHADYIVVVKSKEYNYKTNDNWITVLGHVRMATTTVKEVMIAEVVTPHTSCLKSHTDLSSYSVREIQLMRKIPVVINEDVD